MSFSDIPLYGIMTIGFIFLFYVAMNRPNKGEFVQLARNIEVSMWRNGHQCADCYRVWLTKSDPLAPCPYCGGFVDDMVIGRYVRYNGLEYIQARSYIPDHVVCDVAVGHIAADGTPITPPIRLKGLYKTFQGVGKPRYVAIDEPPDSTDNIRGSVADNQH